MNEIDNITLNCFANKQQYEHVMKKNDFHKDKQFLLDKKFYKKRVIDLTKKLFRNDVDDLQLYNTFDSYTKSCINYLKFLDKTDIIQEKYSYIIDYSKNSGELDDYDISNGTVPVDFGLVADTVNNNKWYLTFADNATSAVAHTFTYIQKSFK